MVSYMVSSTSSSSTSYVIWNSCLHRFLFNSLSESFLMVVRINDLSWENT